MKRKFVKIMSISIALVLSILLSACSAESVNPYKEYFHEYNIINDNYRTYYEVFVGQFYDGDGNGRGDFKGLEEKLDYLNDGDDTTMTDLGVNGLWLMPIMPSPSYHKYDVTDYKAIDPQYGTMADFESFMAKAKSRDIKVIIDLVINHTSFQHIWFSRAVKDLKENGPNGQYASYYNFSSTKPGSGWYQVSGTSYYYEALFWDQMPDLNMNSQAVRNEIEDIVEFWINKGVGGFRLDAAKHIYNTEAENRDFWSWFSGMCKEKLDDCYLLAEVWEGDRNKLLPYYEAGIDSMFNYPMATASGLLAGKVLNTNTASGRDFAVYLESWRDTIKSKNANAIDTPFLSGHDNDRSSSYFGYDATRIKQAAAMYLLMPGSPMIYYGEEIGMEGVIWNGGSNTDQNARLPMQWNAEGLGMTRAPSGSDKNITHRFGTVESQTGDIDSLLYFYKRAIRIRNENPEIGRGTITALNLNNDQLCAYRMTYNDSSVIVIHNVSKSTIGATKTAVTVSLSKNTYGYSGLRSYLDPQKEAPTLNGETLTIPAFGTVVLK